MKYITRTTKTEVVKVIGVKTASNGTLSVEQFTLTIPDGLSPKKRGEYVREKAPANVAVAQFSTDHFVEQKRIMSYETFMRNSVPMLDGETITEAVKRIFNDNSAEIVEA